MEFQRALGFAQRVWVAMEQHAVPPTPRHYEVLYGYVSGGDPEVGRRVEACLRPGDGTVGERLEAVYEDLIAARSGVDGVASSADALELAARTLVESVSGSRAALQSYSTSLSAWAGRLDTQPSRESLMQAVAALQAETTRAGERNRSLETELSSAATQITKLRENLSQVRQEATVDALTGILNRRAFDLNLRRSVRAARAEPESGFCLLMLDVDHFKRFNDTHGHRAGDQVLKAVGRLLADNVKGRDTAARYGGEEFAILLAGADLRSAEIVGRQICERMAGQRLVRRETGQAVGQITLSIGVAHYQVSETGPGLVERADRALYEAKRSGRNRVCVDLPAAA